LHEEARNFLEMSVSFLFIAFFCGAIKSLHASASVSSVLLVVVRFKVLCSVRRSLVVFFLLSSSFLFLLSFSFCGCYLLPPTVDIFFFSFWRLDG